MVEQDKVVEVQAGEISYDLYLPHKDIDHIQRQISRSGQPYELTMLLDMLQRSAANDVVVDVGANVGNHTIFLAASGRRVMAYEPNKELAEAIEITAGINSLSQSVFVRHMGCGAENQQGDLSIGNNTNLGTARITLGDGDVRIVTLDSQDLPGPVQLLKIDVEGMECDVLQGASNVITRDRPYIYVEAATPEDTDDILASLKPLGYVHCKVFNATATHLFAPEELVQANAIFPATAESFFWRADEHQIQTLQRTNLSQSKDIAERDDEIDALTHRCSMQAEELAQKNEEIESLKSKDKNVERVIQLEQEQQELKRANSSSRNTIKRLLSKIHELDTQRADASSLGGTGASLVDVHAIRVSLQQIQKELNMARAKPVKQLKRKTLHQLLRYLASSSIPLSDKTRSRFRSSAAKRDPLRPVPFGTLGAEPGRPLTPEMQVSSSRWVAMAGAHSANETLEKNQPLIPPDILDEFLRDEVIEVPMHNQGSCLVSVVIPVYNAEKWIERSIKSALFQYGVDVEVIVVDDGSSDGTIGLVTKLAESYPNVRMFSLLRNFGCYYARNIGISHACGEFVTVLDSDDLMGPNRLSAQVANMMSNPDAVACQCRQRRWTADFKKDLSEPGYGENGLLWRRRIMESIGFYDSVRFAGDTEFRMRIKKYFGPQSITRIAEEGVFLRTLENSLALSSSTSAYRKNNGRLQQSLSPSRQAYYEAFTDWHENGHDLYMPFPVTRRPFALSDEKQEASVSMGHAKVGAMASFPPRRETLELVINKVLPQLDVLILYLNQYETVPEFCKDDRIRVILGSEAEGDLRDNGKFFALPESENSYIFTFDDDIAYPDDYVSKMIHCIEMLNRSSVVGVHAVIFPEKNFKSLGEREVYAFNTGQRGRFVDLLGTGTSAWHSSTLKPRLSHFETKGVCDLWFAKLAAEESVPLFSVPRPAGWLEKLGDYTENLYREAVARPDHYFGVYRTSLERALQKNRVRTAAEGALLKQVGAEAIYGAGIDLSAEAR